jgi:hypothetical protein
MAYSQVRSQSILLDKPVRAGELTLYPELKNESNYYYISDKIRIAQDANGRPQFLFIRYVKNEDIASGEDETMTESAVGGGIVHALFELSVSQEQLRQAAQALRRIDSDGKIIGPVTYKSGTIALISSVADKNGNMAEKVLGIGNAPILEGQKAAISVQLNKLGSKLLWETFKTPTPDFSISFEMEVEGYLSPKRVKIEANFDQIYKHQAFEAAIAMPILSGEIKAAFDDLHDEGAIKVEQIGEDEELNKIMETAYNKLTTLMFDKIGGTGTPQLAQMFPDNKKSMLDRATENLEKARKEAREENARLDRSQSAQTSHSTQVRAGSSQRRDQAMASRGQTYTPPPASQRRDTPRSDTARSGSGGRQRVSMPSMSVAVSYQMKQIKRTGRYVIDLNKYTSDTRNMRFDENVGRIDCPDCFVEVNLDDPLMKQRNIFVSLDGMNSQEFDKYINYVNVVMRKKHQNSETTIDEVRIDKSKFNQTGNNFGMLYGWKGDNDRAKWLNYEYKSQWSFFGGYTIETDWQPTEFASVSLTPPFDRKPIYVELDPDFAAKEQIRAVEIKIYYKPKDKEELLKTNLKVAQEELSKTLEIILPRGVEDYDYEVTWYIKGADPKISPRRSSKLGMLYFDHIIS